MVKGGGRQPCVTGSRELCGSTTPERCNFRGGHRSAGLFAAYCQASWWGPQLIDEGGSPAKNLHVLYPVSRSWEVPIQAKGSPSGLLTPLSSSP